MYPDAHGFFQNDKAHIDRARTVSECFKECNRDFLRDLPCPPQSLGSRADGACLGWAWTAHLPSWSSVYLSALIAWNTNDWIDWHPSTHLPAPGEVYIPRRVKASCRSEWTCGTLHCPEEGAREPWLQGEQKATSNPNLWKEEFTTRLDKEKQTQCSTLINNHFTALCLFCNSWSNCSNLNECLFHLKML